MRRLIALALATSITFLPSLGHAACTDADVRGNWQVYISFFAGSSVVWVRCFVRILADGRLPRTICPTSLAGSELTGGSLSVINEARCTIRGRFEFSDGDLVLPINHATMASDKATVAGVGTVNTDPFTFEMLKLD